jgi:hypothetical protein
VKNTFKEETSMSHHATSAGHSAGFSPTEGPDTVTWIAESGLLTAATLVVIAVVVARQHWPILRTPPPAAASRSTF